MDIGLDSLSATSLVGRLVPEMHLLHFLFLAQPGDVEGARIRACGVCGWRVEVQKLCEMGLLDLRA